MNNLLWIGDTPTVLVHQLALDDWLLRFLWTLDGSRLLPRILSILEVRVAVCLCTPRIMVRMCMEGEPQNHGKISPLDFALKQVIDFAFINGTLITWKINDPINSLNSPPREMMIYVAQIHPGEAVTPISVSAFPNVG